MVLNPCKNGDIEINNYLLREEAFDHTVTIYDWTQRGAPNLVKRCSICNKLNLKNQTDWIEPGELSKEKAQSFLVIHTVCPDCKDRGWKKVLASA